MENLTIIVFLLFGVAFIGILSNRFRFPFPIALVLCGIAISLIPGLPVVELDPEIVFLLFLPPLLYEAAWNTNWHDFKANIRPISLAAIGLVLFTTVLVAVVAYYLVPGFGWAESFLLGAIVSPPDAVSATSVTKGLGLNPKIITLLEGESLVNDASGLVAYKYALAAVATGNFIFWKAGLNFMLVAAAGISIGLAIGYLMYLIHKKFISDPVVEVTLTLLTPFTSYLLAEHFHFSGVLAVVTTGLYLSFRSDVILTHQSRIMGYSVWQVVSFILNGLIFVLIGLQLRNIMKGIGNEYQTGELILYGAIVSLSVILIRFIWVIPAAMLQRMLNRSLRKKEIYDTKNLVIFGWAGMRGVVSMAAALALPLTFPNGQAFANRYLIIFLTFCVILSTLVLLGLTLPLLIKKLKTTPYSIAEEEYSIRTQVVSESITHIEENLSLVSDDLLNNIKSKYEIKYNRLQHTDLPPDYFGDKPRVPENIFNAFTRLQLDMLEIERKAVNQLHRSGAANQEVLRKIEYELDLEETRLKMEFGSLGS